MTRLDGLQALRGLAAAWVLLFHLVPAAGLGEALPGLAAVARWGFAGVDLFFVLSGFVMWHTTRALQGGAAARRFLLRRLARIYLGYWPWLVIAVVMFLLLAPGSLAEKNLPGSLLLLEIDDRRLVISVAWSLAFELYFYALFAALLGLAPRLRALVVCAIPPAVGAFDLWLLAAQAPALDGGAGEGFFVLSPFVAEFFAGAVVSLLSERLAGRQGPGARIVAVACGAALSFTGLWLGTASGALPQHQVERLGSFGLAGCGLLLAAAMLEGRVRWPRWAVALGDQSYALYLGHPILISVATLVGLIGPSVARPAVAAALAGGAFLLAFLYHRLIERPLYRGACRRIDRH